VPSGTFGAEVLQVRLELSGDVRSSSGCPSYRGIRETSALDEFVISQR